MISWLSGDNKDGFNLTGVVEKIEELVPLLPDAEAAKTTLVAIHVLWHEWLPPEDHAPSAQKFIEQYGPLLDAPTPAATTVGLLSNRTRPTWTPDEWAAMASDRYASRRSGKEQPLPPAIDTLIQLEAADQLEAAGRHEEAIVFAANAVEESPGNIDLIAWEERLSSGSHDPNFGVHRFLFGVNGEAGEGDETVAQPPE